MKILSPKRRFCNLKKSGNGYIFLIISMKPDFHKKSRAFFTNLKNNSFPKGSWHDFNINNNRRDINKFLVLCNHIEKSF